MDTVCCRWTSPLGEIVIAADGTGICGLWFTGQKYDRAGFETAGWTEPGNNALLEQAVNWLEEYFSGQKPTICLKLTPRGTEFQKRVWNELLTIPYGCTRSYGEIAKRLGCKSARAVGSAVGRNPLSLLIPCHRVVGSGGKLTGYAGGLERKKFLLELEKSSCLIDK